MRKAAFAIASGGLKSKKSAWSNNSWYIFVERSDPHSLDPRAFGARPWPTISIAWIRQYFTVIVAQEAISFTYLITYPRSQGKHKHVGPHIVSLFCDT